MKTRRTFSSEETEKIYQLAESLTGSCQSGRFRREVLVMNVQRRLDELQCRDLEDYLSKIESIPGEAQRLISALTIHTTFWFREAPHFDALTRIIGKFHAAKTGRPFRLWSAASSTGEEAYTAGLVLESFRSANPGFEYEIHGTDIDPVSVQIASRALYSDTGLKSIPEQYRRWILIGSKKTKGWITLDPEIRKRTRFSVNNLSTETWPVQKSFYDWVMCRNVLIYFSADKVLEIVQRLSERVITGGVLCLGHSEILDQAPNGFSFVGNGCYTSGSANSKPTPLSTRRKVLIVEDSRVVRKVLRSLMEKHGFETFEADSTRAAAQAIKNHTFHVITLDIHMPEEDGPVWLKRERNAGMKCPVILVTDADPKEVEEVLTALQEGAQAYFLKSQLSDRPGDILELMDAMIEKSHQIRTSAFRPKLVKMPALAQVDAILIGASTGGPEVLCQLLKDLPRSSSPPPILVVQHITPAFAKPFAQRLATVSGLTLQEPLDGIPLKSGCLYMAWGDRHIGIGKVNGSLCLKVADSPAMHGHRPAVDHLFLSAANVKARCLSILLTGMGRDGAQGIKAIFDNKNSICLGQDEKSSTVYGMPMEAERLGALHDQGDPTRLRACLNEILKQHHQPLRATAV